jgi:hypothetical protein
LAPGQVDTALRTTSPRWSLRCEHPSKSIPTVDSARRYSERYTGFEQRHSLEKKHYLHDKQSRTIGEWLDICNIDLLENGVRWLHYELDGLPDLRARPKRTSGQCIAWHISKDDRAVNLPPFEELVPRLDVESCRDAWLQEKPIKLREDRFEDLKAHLLEETISKIRLLNVPVTKRMVSRRWQRQHPAMVRERVRRFHGVGDDHVIECHNATTNVTPPRRGDRDPP